MHPPSLVGGLSSLDVEVVVCGVVCVWRSLSALELAGLGALVLARIPVLTLAPHTMTVDGCPRTANDLLPLRTLMPR